jgi:hypothetical protein
MPFFQDAPLWPDQGTDLAYENKLTPFTCVGFDSHCLHCHINNVPEWMREEEGMSTDLCR